MIKAVKCVLLHNLACGFLVLMPTTNRGDEPLVAPYERSSTIESITFDWSTHQSHAPGSDNWPVTWGDDNHLYTAWGDGGGFGGTNQLGRVSLGVARIEGSAEGYRGFNIWGGHQPERGQAATFAGKSYGILAVDGVFYMWVGLFRPNQDPFDEVRLAVSKDHGRTWELADWNFSKADGVMLPTLLNFGCDYAGARDNFVYSYLIRFRSQAGPDDYHDKVPWLQCQRPGTVDLARVEKSRILDRSAWEFFAGFDDSSTPNWVADLRKRQPVFEDANGVGWNLSVSFNAPLQRYLLTTEHTETHRGNIGIHDAPEPWGPWTTAHYSREFGKDHVTTNCFYWNFVNKWLSPDGQRFTMVFTGRKENDSWNTIGGQITTFPLSK
ncbi:MAG: DUF4185 domain-containing protein [Pirellulaceae bacterium]